MPFAKGLDPGKAVTKCWSGFKLYDNSDGYSFSLQVTPTKRLNALHLFEYYNNSSRNRIKYRGMSCNRLCIPVCGILWSESSLALSDLQIGKIDVPEFDRNVFYEK